VADTLLTDDDAEVGVLDGVDGLESADTPLAHGGELILRDGAPAGEVTSAAYGHSLQAVVALGYVKTGGAAIDAAFLGAKFEIDIAGDRVPVRASLKALYDPTGAKVKG